MRPNKAAGGGGAKLNRLSRVEKNLGVHRSARDKLLKCDSTLSYNRHEEEKNIVSPRVRAAQERSNISKSKRIRNRQGSKMKTSTMTSKEPQTTSVESVTNRLDTSIGLLSSSVTSLPKIANDGKVSAYLA